jgi:hypothetical protein
METRGKMDINNELFVKSLNNLNKNITTNVSVENYFTFNSEKKVATQYLVLGIVVKTLGTKSKTNQDLVKLVISSLMKRNELLEYYELAEVLKDVKNNFDYLFEIIYPTPIKPKRTIKTNKSNDI